MKPELISLAPIALTAILTIPLAITDIREHRLPNKYTYALFIATLGCLLLASWQLRTWSQLLLAVLAGIATFGVGSLLARAGAIGMGDIKLLTSLHMVLAWHQPLLPLFSLVLGLSSATVIGLAGMIMGKFGPKSLMPLGPYLLLGFLVVASVPVGQVTVAAWS